MIPTDTKKGHQFRRIIRLNAGHPGGDPRFPVLGIQQIHEYAKMRIVGGPSGWRIEIMANREESPCSFLLKTAVFQKPSKTLDSFCGSSLRL